ncbi:MAG: FAD-dependent oxidoreductase [Deltaproteobacteria bacterium]|nr:FAD-dependent oxidoreductase [Deltaproteobacteria bacterium]
MKKKVGSALVVGSGIAGIRASLDLAEQGYRVTLIDRAPSLGGVLSQLDYQFPSDHCGMCKMLPLVERDAGSQYCLRKGLFHENIDILLSTELVGLDGEPGKFQVTLHSKPTSVDAQRCIGCGECERVCPVEVKDLFNAGMTSRKAVYLPVPHSIPNHYVVDLEACTLCGKCEEVCPTGAIDLGSEARRAFRILVVDDERVVRDSLKEWLEDEGFQVHVAASGAETLEKLSRETFHLMLLDIKMPGMDGVEVLRRSMELNPDLPVVMMTAYATVETAVEAMKIGALDYLMKPFDPDTLVPLVLQLHQKIERTGEQNLEVGAVILASGFESYDPLSGKNTYGYGVLPDVLTSVEFERLMSGTGPTGGRLVRPSDGKEVERVAWLQCVGSRDPQAGADFCSSVCCMFAVKEALLAKKKTGGRVDACIFYMDMRTFGKGFERYRDRAEEEEGVRFIRSRVHSVETSGDGKGLRIVYADTGGTRQEEEFDLVVLSTGQRPPAGTEALAEMTGVALNPWGFCKSEGLSPSVTAREGVYIAGSFSGPKDISETVIQAGSASLEASRMIHSKGGGLALEANRDDENYRDVSRESPRVFLALCSCNGTLADPDTFKGLTDWAAARRSVSETFVTERLCTREGWEGLQEALGKTDANRVLIAACMPYLYGGKLRELGKKVGLQPSLMDVVDIRTPAISTGEEGREEADLEIRSRIAMGLGRVRGVDPVPPPTGRIVQRALVVGGGMAGMWAALAIADHGYEVDLVERGAELGGNCRSLHRTLEGQDPQPILEETLGRVNRHPNIRVYLNARILHSEGRVGRFSTTIEKEDGSGGALLHGVTILATGGREARTQSYGYGTSEAVVTQRELERKLDEGELDPTALETVTMIQCVDSREEPRNYCSRLCCASALKNALYIKGRNPEADVCIFYRDFMAHGFMESYYTQARKAGVVFIQYDRALKPQVTFEDGKPVVSSIDPILGREVRVPSDLLVLSTGIVPNEAEEVARLFGVDLDRDGFFQEAESKWRPVDFLREGIFVCGLAHSPRSLEESIATAGAAAQRALRLLGRERLPAASVVAEVRHSLCSLCEKCVETCPYGARWLDEEEEKIRVDVLMCQGCGSCAAVCPNSATVLLGYRDNQVFEVIDAALQEG